MQHAGELQAISTELTAAISELHLSVTLDQRLWEEARAADEAAWRVIEHENFQALLAQNVSLQQKMDSLTAAVGLIARHISQESSDPTSALALAAATPPRPPLPPPIPPALHTTTPPPPPPAVELAISTASGSGGRSSYAGGSSDSRGSSGSSGDGGGGGDGGDGGGGTSNHSGAMMFPQWIPDSAAKECMFCEKTFRALHTKHHCRECGKVICKQCCTLQYLERTGRNDLVCTACQPGLPSSHINGAGAGGSGGVAVKDGSMSAGDTPAGVECGVMQVWENQRKYPLTGWGKPTGMPTYSWAKSKRDAKRDLSLQASDLDAILPEAGSSWYVLVPAACRMKDNGLDRRYSLWG